MRTERLRLMSLINSTFIKTGCKNLNLKGTLQNLFDGYNGQEVTASVSEQSCCKSVNRLCAYLKAVNEKTNIEHRTLTGAINTLCSEYSFQKPVYKFGVLSDLHIQYDTGVEDYKRALNYLKSRVTFTCICGDLVSAADENKMLEYRDLTENYADNMPIYEVAGNHESYHYEDRNDIPTVIAGQIDTNLWNTATGKPLQYSFTYGDDVFVMLSIKSENKDDLFSSDALLWLERVLEINKNKRCFVFMHTPEHDDMTADPSGLYSYMGSGASGAAFVSILKRYKNTVWFHGHTHLTLNAEYPPASDINIRGYRSVHIPSLVSPRYYSSVRNRLEDAIYDSNENIIGWHSPEAEGFIVEVYQNRIELHGINFAAGESKTDVKPFANEIFALDFSI